MRSRLNQDSIFLTFLRLGLTSFGGPVAHLGYFRSAFVVKRAWLTEDAFADLVALCQLLPGPASSQVGAAIGLLHGGLRGALAAWLGFTLPSAIALAIFALCMNQMPPSPEALWLYTLKIVAIVIVAKAVWGMGRKLCPDAPRVAIAAASTVTMLLSSTPLAQLAVIVVGGVLGILLFGKSTLLKADVSFTKLSRRTGIVALSIYATLLALIPVFAVSDNPVMQLFQRFYGAGALVFGGGHVVLPLLQAQMVPTGLMSNDVFLAGYGAAQAVPGPLFTVSAYLGAVAATPVAGVTGATIALVAIFLPGLLLIIGALPFWDSLRRRPRMQAAVRGINAAVVGILAAALLAMIAGIFWKK